MAKIRTGFVSNSSSSSYVIHASEFPSEEKFKQIINELVKLEEKEEGEFPEWGENGRTFEVDGRYLFVETYYIYYDIVDAFERAGVNFRDLKKIHVNG